MIKKIISKKVFWFLMMAMLVLSGQMRAQTNTLSQESQTEKIVVYGHEYIIQPYQMSDTNWTWDLTKGYLPPVILEMPDRKMNEGEILSAVKAQKKKAVENYEKVIEALARYFIKQDPDLDMETARLYATEIRIVEDAARYDEKIQKIVKEYIALSYLLSMLEGEQY